MNSGKWEDSWLGGCETLSLLRGEIHVWRMRISQMLPWVSQEHLSAEERSKLADLVNEKVRNQFLISRWGTRQIISKYLARRPQDLKFEVSELGKPQVALPKCDLQFSRTHSGDWLVVGLARCTPIGVDIEQLQNRTQMGLIVERWFGVEEQQKFAGLEDSEKRSFFYLRWTEREAVLKAAGVGISQLSNYSIYQKKHQAAHFDVACDVVGCIATMSEMSGCSAQSPGFYSLNPLPIQPSVAEL